MLSKATVAAEVDTVLLEIEGPQLLLARDIVNTPYLCSLVRTDKDGDLFLAVQISSDRLQQLREGSVDLRTALQQPEMHLHYEGRVVRGEKKPRLDLVAVTEVPETWLPDPDLFINEFTDEVSNAEVVREAMEKNAAVIVSRINPPEARGLVPRVDADHLSDYIRAFQSLVRQAVRSVTSAQPGAKKNAVDPSALQVFAFSGGSFKVHFESKDHANLFGDSIVGAAMERIDELARLADENPDLIKQGLEKNRGPILAAYRHLLRFIDEKEAPFSYEWCEPSRTTARGERISTAAAKAMVAILDNEEVLMSERFVFEGRVTSVNVDRWPFTWTARTREDESRRGQVGEHIRGVLDGAIIKTELYLFEGDERLISPASGKPPEKRLFLDSIKKVESK